MHARQPAWAVQAWQHWHRPWAVTHASWLPPLHGASELALRLHYPAWCERYALEPVLDGFADTLWWRLLGLSPASFDQVAERVGLALVFAGDRRRRLLRGAALDVTRWALERSHFIPGPVADAVGECAPEPSAHQHAAVSLQWCLQGRPTLWARLRLRFAREHLRSADAAASQGAPGEPVQAHLGRLWRTALRAAPEGVAT